ncbi:MAG: 30S ribosomal protein S20 [Bryobacteraceae bacterium]
MANHVSALKRVRMTERRTAVNNARRSRLRTGLKALRRLMEAKDVNGAAAVAPKTFSIVDRAAKWGVIKKNTAARYKSRIALRLRKLQAA